jgi:hypothetical protein
LLESKNPYSQEIFRNAIDDLNKKEPEKSSLSTVRQSANTPENRARALAYIEQRTADGSYDSATAQALKNFIDIGNVYDAIFEMGKAQMAGIRVIQQKAGALSALSKKGHTGVVKSKR